MSLDFLFAPFESNPSWDIIKTLSSYYGLKDYLTAQYMERFHPERVRRISANPFKNLRSGDEYFWQEVGTGRLLEGQIVRLTDFHISPWFPRKPGTYWSYSASIAREKAHRQHIAHEDKSGIIFDIYGKLLMTELGGIGCVNFRKDRDEVLITATASGYTERGIPLICPQSVWQHISAEIVKYGTISVDLIGMISPIPLTYDSYLLRSPSIPKVAVKINSILNVKSKPSSTIITVTPWTIFELPDSDQPYGFTYITHDLFENDLSSSIRWMHKYINNHGGETIITDFDEELNQLNAQFPLSGCLNGNITSNDVLQYCQRVKTRFDNAIHNRYRY